MSSALPKVALVSIGIGRIQRGFERYFSDLFNVIRDELDITLFKSGGVCSAHEKIPNLLRPATTLARALPLRELGAGREYKTYKHDCIAFGLTLLADVIWKGYDIIHVIDYPLAKVLQHLRRTCRFQSRLLLTNGNCIPPAYYPKVDHIHHVAQPFYQEAVATGVPPSHLTMIPCGIHVERFGSRDSGRDLRTKYGISESTFVIIAVTAVKRLYKRVDHIIEEVSRLDGDVLLWIDGNPEDESIPELARRKLGSRCRITHMPSDQVGEIYRVADVMVHACLAEAFGLAIVEALSTGLTVLVHDSPHYEWLVQDRECLVDMSVPGKLASHLQYLANRKQALLMRSQERAATVRQRFDWSLLKTSYVEMYRKVADPRSARSFA